MNLLSTVQSGWRSLVGFLSMAGGTTLASTSTDTHLAPWLVGAGAVVIAAERVAQAFEKPTTTNLTAAEKSAQEVLDALSKFQNVSQGKVG